MTKAEESNLWKRLVKLEEKVDALMVRAVRSVEPRIEEPITPSDLPPPRDNYTPQRRL